MHIITINKEFLFILIRSISCSASNEMSYAQKFFYRYNQKLSKRIKLSDIVHSISKLKWQRADYVCRRAMTVGADEFQSGDRVSANLAWDALRLAGPTTCAGWRWMIIAEDWAKWHKLTGAYLHQWTD